VSGTLFVYSKLTHQVHLGFVQYSCGRKHPFQIRFASNKINVTTDTCKAL